MVLVESRRIRKFISRKFQSQMSKVTKSQIYRDKLFTKNISFTNQLMDKKFINKGLIF